MKKCISLFLIILCTSAASNAVGFNSTFVGKTLKHNYLSTRDLVISPISWDKTDFLVLGGVSALTAASVLWIDGPLNTYVRENYNPGVANTLDYFKPIGNVYPAISMAGFAIHSLFAKSNYSAETALLITESFIINTVLVKSVKYMTGRTRPNAGRDPHLWNGPTGSITTFYKKGTSFYSGHTSGAFSAASVIAWRYRDIPWVPWVSYSLATLNSVQRVYQDSHWLSDTIYGAMVGTAIGLFLAKNHDNNPYKIYPMVQPGANGITMVLEIGKN